MVEYITPDRIANSIMLDKNFEGYNFIVEGVNDYKLFNKFIIKDVVSIKQAFGFQNVIEVIRILTDRNFTRKLGIIDADFRRITNEEVSLEELFITDDHDIEIMILKSDAFTYTLEILSSNKKIMDFEKKIKKEIREKIFELGKEIGYLRLANKKYNLGLVFKPNNENGKLLKYKNFISTDDLSYLGDDKMINTVFNYSINKSDDLKEKEIILEKFNEIKDESYSTHQLVNGHDFTNIVFLLLKKVLQSKNKMLCDFTSIEECLILAYELDYFKKTLLYKKISRWSSDNQIKVFK